MRAGPTAATSHVGRRRELAELSRVLRTTRLLTITGAGGAGKTRLASALVARLRTNAAWVELAPLRDPADVAAAVERSIGANADGTLSAQTVRDAVRGGLRLIILDNCEHVIEACRTVVARILEASPDVRILATTRTPLAAAGELTWRTPPMSLPAPGDASGPGYGGRADAVRLFVERARAVRPDFMLDETSSNAVHHICRKLEGIPLAIELAAARLRHLPLSELEAAISSLRTLDAANGADGESSRHRTMTAALDWSYALLAEDERQLMRRLSVFAGGFDLEGARALAGGHVADLGLVVGNLVDKSLVDFSAGTGRYRMLEPTRLYAEQRLREQREYDAAIAAAAGYFVTLASTTHENDGHVRDAEMRLRDEFPNAAAMLPWLIEHDAAGALRLLTRYAHRHRTAVPGHVGLVRAWLERALAVQPTRDADRAHALLAHAALTWATDHVDARAQAVRDAIAEATAIASEIRDSALGTMCRFHLATATWRYDTPGRALATYDAVIPGLAAPRLTAFALSGRSVVRAMLGDTRGARTDVEEALAIWDCEGTSATIAERTVTLFCAAEIAFVGGDLDGAEAALREAITARQLGREPQESLPFEFLAHVASERGDAHRALRLAGIADRLRRDLGTWPVPWFRLADRSWLTALERRLGPLEVRLRAEGQRMPDGVAVSYALDERVASDLTEREMTVARLVASGLTDKEIGQHLRVSSRTAENHVQHVRDKLGVRSRAEIARWMAEQAVDSDRAGRSGRR